MAIGLINRLVNLVINFIFPINFFRHLAMEYPPPIDADTLCQIIDFGIY